MTSCHPLYDQPFESTPAHTVAVHRICRRLRIRRGCTNVRWQAVGKSTKKRTRSLNKPSNPLFTSRCVTLPRNIIVSRLFVICRVLQFLAFDLTASLLNSDLVGRLKCTLIDFYVKRKKYPASRTPQFAGGGASTCTDDDEDCTVTMTMTSWRGPFLECGCFPSAAEAVCTADCVEINIELLVMRWSLTQTHRQAAWGDSQRSTWRELQAAKVRPATEQRWLFILVSHVLLMTHVTTDAIAGCGGCGDLFYLAIEGPL